MNYIFYNRWERSEGQLVIRNPVQKCFFFTWLDTIYGMGRRLNTSGPLIKVASALWASSGMLDRNKSSWEVYVCIVILRRTIFMYFPWLSDSISRMSSAWASLKPVSPSVLVNYYGVACIYGLTRIVSTSRTSSGVYGWDLSDSRLALSNTNKVHAVTRMVGIGNPELAEVLS